MDHHDLLYALRQDLGAGERALLGLPLDLPV